MILLWAKDSSRLQYTFENGKYEAASEYKQTWNPKQPSPVF